MSAVKYRADIDGLRALAVLPVVIFHVNPSLLPGGFLGVDIFFVISGYLISLILFREQAAGTFSFADFYGRRIRRLFPALIPVLTLSLALGFFALFADEYQRLMRHTSAAIVFMLNFRLMGEAGYFDAVSYSKPMLHLWSLSVEEQFYVFWPVLLLLFRRTRRDYRWLIAVCGAISFTYALRLGNTNPDALYYHPLTRFWELLVGAAAAYYHLKSQASVLQPQAGRSRVRDAMSLAGLVLLASALIGFSKALVHPGMATLWPLAGAAMLIAAGPAAYANRLLSWRPLVAIGLISYPFYLWHWPILSYLRVMESGTPAQWLLVTAALFAVVLAWGTYHWIELPLRRVRNQKLVTTGLCIAMGTLLAFSLIGRARYGWPDRSALQYVKAYEPQMTGTARQDVSCLALFVTGTAPVYCRQQNAGPRMIAIVGDSHAHALYIGVAELAETRGYGTLLLANSGCPPFLGTAMGRNDLERGQCIQSIKAIVDAVVADKRVVNVILVSRGPQYLNGLGFGAVEANYNYPPIAAQALIGGSQQSDPARVFADGLAATARRLNEAGMRVSYLLQVPELGVPARDCLGRPLSLLKKEENCTVPYSDYASRMSAYRSAVLGLKDSVPFLGIIDIENLLCTSVRCSGFIDGTLLYADDNHLSIAGSRRVASQILNRAVEGLAQ